MESSGICPSCGKDNQCAMASGAHCAEACWCASLSIPSEAVEGLPRDRCICAECATAVQEDSRYFGRDGIGICPPNLVHPRKRERITAVLWLRNPVRS